MATPTSHASLWTLPCPADSLTIKRPHKLDDVLIEITFVKELKLARSIMRQECSRNCNHDYNDRHEVVQADFFLLYRKWMGPILPCLVPFTAFGQLQLNSGQWLGFFYLLSLSTIFLQLICGTSSDSGCPNPSFIAFFLHPSLDHLKFKVAIYILHIRILLALSGVTRSWDQVHFTSA